MFQTKIIGCFFSNLVNLKLYWLQHIDEVTPHISHGELDVKAVLFSYFRNQKSTVRNGKTENDFLEVTLAAEDGNFYRQVSGFLPVTGNVREEVLLHSLYWH